MNTENILTMTEEDIDKMQELRSNNQDNFAKLFSSRLERISMINDTDKFVPWFLECNAHRYGLVSKTLGINFFMKPLKK